MTALVRGVALGVTPRGPEAEIARTDLTKPHRTEETENR